VKAATSPLRGTGRRAGLDHDAIVERALTLVEAEGSTALTMRRLAAELGVATTTIYWHVGGRDELITALIQRLSERHAEIEIEGAGPSERVMCVARHVWDSALAHRNVTALAHQVGATSLLEMPLEIALARELDTAGLRGEVARDALRAILMCVAGFLVVAFRSDDPGPARHQARTLWADITADGIDRSTVTALREPPDLPALFETAVRALVDRFVVDVEPRDAPVA